MSATPRGMLHVQYTMTCAFCNATRFETYTGRLRDVLPVPSQGPWHLLDGELVCSAHVVKVDEEPFR